MDPSTRASLRDAEQAIRVAEAEIETAQHALFRAEERCERIREDRTKSKNPEAEFLLLNEQIHACFEHITRQKAFIAELRYFSGRLLKFRNDTETLTELEARDPGGVPGCEGGA